MTGVSHGRCVQRVCCRSWSCTPHVADCPSIDDWARGPVVAANVTVAVERQSNGQLVVLEEPHS